MAKNKVKDTIYAVKRKLAIDTLVRYGLARYVSDEDLYHGRASANGEQEWKVKSNFQNAGNSTGNANVYNINGLYVGTEQTSRDFAKARITDSKPNADVYRIVARDKDAVIINTDFEYYSLAPADRDILGQAMQVLTEFSIYDTTPVSYNYKDVMPFIIDEIKSFRDSVNSYLLTQKQKDQIIEKLSTKSEIRKKITGSVLESLVSDAVDAGNTRFLLSTEPSEVLQAYIDGEDSMFYDQQKYSISNSYISAWCDSNKVIGIEQLVKSGTLDRFVNICNLFDTKKIATEKQEGERLQNITRTYGDVANILQYATEDKDIEALLKNGSPEEIMSNVKENKKCKKLFEKPAYVWEGYSVGQHTEAVLRFFDENYSSSYPESLFPFIKISMLAHDIGKGYEKDRTSKYFGKHKQANEAMAEYLYDALSVPQNYRSIINFVINDSQSYTSELYFADRAYLSKEDNIEAKWNITKELASRCRETLEENLGSTPTADEIIGLERLCILLQQCDSGAYTIYATINDEKGFAYKGGSERFTRSFEEKDGVLRLREDLDGHGQ